MLMKYGGIFWSKWTRLSPVQLPLWLAAWGNTHLARGSPLFAMQLGHPMGVKSSRLSQRKINNAIPDTQECQLWHNTSQIAC